MSADIMTKTRPWRASRRPAPALVRSGILLLATLAVLTLPAAVPGQESGFDEQKVALVYHRISGDPLDVNAIAERSDAARRASNFDRPDIVAAEVKRLGDELAAVDTAAEFALTINDHISEYDRDRGEFSIQLFSPGSYVPIDAFGQRYQLVFANVGTAGSIPMPLEQARTFDARLNTIGRSVLNELRFRVIGKGDPAGAVTGERVIRAELLSTRLLDRAGRVVFTPDLSVASTTPTAAPAPFDASTADVAGFRVGVKASDLESTLQRLFGSVQRESPGKKSFPGFTEALVVNSMGCFNIPGRRNNPGPGAVCVTAFLDGNDVVRGIRIERLFAWFDGELFRKALVQKYGPVADARNGSSFALGWGAEVDPSLVYDQSGPHRALAAYYTSDEDFMSRGSNSLPRIRVVLQLVDAEWAAKQGK